MVSETLDTVLLRKTSGNLGKGVNGAESFRGSFQKIRKLYATSTSQSGQKFLGRNFRNSARFPARKNDVSRKISWDISCFVHRERVNLTVMIWDRVRISRPSLVVKKKPNVVNVLYFRMERLLIFI